MPQKFKVIEFSLLKLALATDFDICGPISMNSYNENRKQKDFYYTCCVVTARAPAVHNATTVTASRHAAMFVIVMCV